MTKKKIRAWAASIDGETSGGWIRSTKDQVRDLIGIFSAYPKKRYKIVQVQISILHPKKG